MKITIEPQSPDGVNVTISDMILDTYEEAFEVIKLCEAIMIGKKIDVADCVKMFKKMGGE